MVEPPNSTAGDWPLIYSLQYLNFSFPSCTVCRTRRTNGRQCVIASCYWKACETFALSSCAVYIQSIPPYVS